MFQKGVLQMVTTGFEQGTIVHTVASAFTETMLEPMMKRHSLYPAKGTTDERYAHNSDQMMLTHILNGLFPSLTLVHEAQKRQLPALSRLNEEALKVYVLGYALHDLDKILGDAITQDFTIRTKDTTMEAYRMVQRELEQLDAHKFLPDMKSWISEITWLAINTQRRRNILLSNATLMPFEETVSDELEEVAHSQTHYLHKKVRTTLRDLCTFSDLIAYFAKSPEDAVSGKAAMRISNLISEMTDDVHMRSFVLRYHKLTDVRGLLTNQIHNGVIRYLDKSYNSEQKNLLPFLFYPDGVVYLDMSTLPASAIDLPTVIETVQDELKETCNQEIEAGGGMSFDGKGRLAYPRYFHDFLSLEQFLNVFVEKARDSGGNTTATNTLEKMRLMQIDGIIPATIPLDYKPDERIGKLGRFLLNYVNLAQKNLKITSQSYSEVESCLIKRVGKELWQQAQSIPSSGGVDYRYYWLAAHYLKVHPLAVYRSESPGTSLEDFFYTCIHDLMEIAGEELLHAPELQGTYLNDLAVYLRKNLTFGFGNQAAPADLPDFGGEFASYSMAKRVRSSKLSCTICNSAYPTEQQEDASVLFQPWVYKNRLPLYKDKNAGGICSICLLELMLRQILFKGSPRNQSGSRLTGKDYEDMELKYFFLYPGFFFTRQTYRLARYIIGTMEDFKVLAVTGMLRQVEMFNVADILHLPLFMLNERDMSEAAEDDMYVFERFEEKHYPGFLFFAKKTFSKKKKSGESSKATVASWVEAIWLGLTLPLVTGARVVVTEEYLPLFHSANDFMETVVLDAPHPSVRHLLPMSRTRFRLDELYGKRSEEGEYVGGILAAFSRAIELHVDTESNARELKLERFARIGRNLETDQLFVFSFLKEQLRREKVDYISPEMANHYNAIYKRLIHYYHAKESEAITQMATRHERITDLYLQFYLPFSPQGGQKRKWPSTHAIVRPIDIAAKSIIRNTLNLPRDEIQLEIVAELKNWLDIVMRKGATGIVLVRGKELDQRVWQFVITFYEEIFLGYAQGERSLLNSRLNRLKHACEEAFTLRMYYKDIPATEQLVEALSSNDEGINDSHD